MDYTLLPARDFEARIRDWADNNHDVLFELTARGGTLCFDRSGFTYRIPRRNLQPGIASGNSRLMQLSAEGFAAVLQQLYADAKPMFDEMAKRKWYCFWDHVLHLAIPTAEADFSDHLEPRKVL